MPNRVLVKIDSGPRRGKALLLEQPGSYLFGRADECYEILPNEDSSVGRRHFAIIIDSVGVTIRDLGSRNGTTVNGRKLVSEAPANQRELADSGTSLRALSDGDVIGAGETLLSVRFLAPLTCSNCDGEISPHSEEFVGGHSSGAVCEACFQSLQSSVSSDSNRSEPCSGCGKSWPAEEVARVPGGGRLCPSCREDSSLHLKALERRMTQLAGAHVPRGGRRLPIEELEIKKAVGSGPAGTVYLAFSKSEEREVALKVVTPDAGLDERSRKSILRRLRAAERLQHPRIVQLLDFALDDGSIYCVSEYYGQGSLYNLIHNRGGRLGQQEAIPLLGDALQGLSHAHNLRIHHGRLKPTDLLLRKESGRVTASVSDFSSSAWMPSKISRDWLADRVWTTYQPSAPAGLNPKQLDVWSIGAIFYYALTGELPTMEAASRPRSPQESAVPIKLRHAGILPELAQVLDRSLSVGPSRPYSNAEEMLEEVEQVKRKLVRLTIRTTPNLT